MINRVSVPRSVSQPVFTSRVLHPHCEALESRYLQASASGMSIANTYFKDAQANPCVATSSDGSFVVAWQSYRQDGSGWGIYAQRYGKNGRRLGKEISVNTFRSGSQTDPAISADKDGAFLVAWKSEPQGNGIYAQRFSSTGLRVGREFKVNDEGAEPAEKPAVAMAPDGRFVIGWTETRAPGRSAWLANQYSVSGKRVHQHNGGGGIVWSGIAIAMNRVGDFSIAWQSLGTTGAGSGIFVQRFSADGNQKEMEFLVASYTPKHRFTDLIGNTQFSSPSIGLDDQGNFVVAWERRTRGETGDRDLFQVKATRFDAMLHEQSLGKIDGFFASTGSDLSSVAMTSTGEFAISWVRDSRQIYVSQYSRSGVFSRTSRLNSPGLKTNSQPVIAMNAAGGVAIAWEQTARGPLESDILVRSTNGE